MHTIKLDIDYIASFNHKPWDELNQSKAMLDTINLDPELIAIKLDDRLIMNASGQNLMITPINDLLNLKPAHDSTMKINFGGKIEFLVQSLAIVDGFSKIQKGNKIIIKVTLEKRQLQRIFMIFPKLDFGDIDFNVLDGLKGDEYENKMLSLQ